MKKESAESLSRRENQIMEVIYRIGAASAKDVQDHMPDPPSYSAVRALLAILVEKGLLRHQKRGRMLVYTPVVARPKATRLALRRLLRTFFDDSPEKLVASLLDPEEQNLSGEEIARIHRLIDDQAGKQPKK